MENRTFVAIAPVAAVLALTAAVLVFAGMMRPRRESAAPGEGEIRPQPHPPSAQSERKPAPRPEPELAAAPPYAVRVVSVRTTHETGDENVIIVWCRCEIDFGREMPERVTLIDPTKVLRGTTGKGAPVGSKPTPRVLRRDLKPGRRRLKFSVNAVVPSDTERIRFIEGIVTKAVAAESEKVVWEDPAAQKGTTLSASGFDFKLAGYRRTASEVEAEVLYRARPGEPKQWGCMAMKCKLYCEDGSLLDISSGSGGGGVGDIWAHRRYRFRLRGRKPKAIEVTFIPAVEEEELPFRLEDVKLPSAPRPVADSAETPVGPRGKKTVRSEGYVFRLHKVKLTREREGERQTGRIDLELKVTLPEEHDAFAVSTSVLNGLAVDDRGTRLATGRWFAHARPPGARRGQKEETLRARFPLPDGRADRLVSFSGKYRVYCAERLLPARFRLAEMPEELEAPIRRGPLSLTTIERMGDLMRFTLKIHKDALHTDDYAWVTGMEYELLDAAGKPMRFAGGSGGSVDGDPKAYEMIRRFKTRGRIPAVFVIRYAIGGSIRDIPFEFKDVGLPRRPGEHYFDRDVF